MSSEPIRESAEAESRQWPNLLGGLSSTVFGSDNQWPPFA